MLVSQFNFELPDELIARYPLASRSASRLLALSPTGIQHRQFSELATLLTENDLLVFNDTKVIPARLHGQKATGGKVELLLERMVSERQCLVHLKASKAPGIGSELYFANECVQFRVLGRQADLFLLELLTQQVLLDIFKQFGQMPLPPYLNRGEEAADQERYQTIYARVDGAVAAPTAGLHFDQAMMQALDSLGVAKAYVTLHVGAGTFQPVRAERVADHKMHQEWLVVPEQVVTAVEACRARGGRVIAVGTTSLRSLEAASQSGQGLAAMTGMTDLFIYPGYKFKTVDALITNFHLPGSSLLMLVAALAGYQPIMEAYQQAIAERYRFFSYGDAMFIDPGAA